MSTVRPGQHKSKVDCTLAIMQDPSALSVVIYIVYQVAVKHDVGAVKDVVHKQRVARLAGNVTGAQNFNGQTRGDGDRTAFLHRYNVEENVPALSDGEAHPFRP